MFKYIHGNLYIFFPLAFILGIVIPGIQSLADLILIPSLMIIVFLSCFRLNVAEVKSLDLRTLLTFYVARFIAFPIGLWWFALHVIPGYETGILILALAPGGVASVPFTAIVGGNIALSFVLLVLSSLASPFTYSGVTAVFTSTEASVDSVEMLKTLCMVVFVPIILHFPFRRFEGLKSWIENEGAAYTVYFISLIIFAAVGMQQEAFTFSPVLGADLFILTLLFILFYIFPYVALRAPENDAKTMAVVSGANNNALAIAVASLFYGAVELRFTVVSEILWVVGFMVFKRICISRSRSTRA